LSKIKILLMTSMVNKSQLITAYQSIISMVKQYFITTKLVARIKRK
jgi:hypothetical protein